MGLLPSPMVKSEQLASALPATRGVRKRAPKNQEGAGGRKARRIWSHEVRFFYNCIVI